MQPQKRILAHVDLDAFFAAVEVLDFPHYAGKPLIVGGLGPRGVVATASYEARRFGVHSALSMAEARRRCPKGIFIKPRKDRYVEVSRRIFDILRAEIDRVEKVSIDEAYLDLSGAARDFDAARERLKKLKEAVKRRESLTLSAGIAPCKFIAKIASDMDKPDGLVAVRTEDVDSFLAPLPAGKIPGVGAVAQKKLQSLGVNTIGELRDLDLPALRREFGKFGLRLYDCARGIDRREVTLHRDPKSQGSENTFPVDQREIGPILEALQEHALNVSRRLISNRMAAGAVTLKLRYSDFQIVTRTRSLEHAISGPTELYESVSALLTKTEAGRRPVRLVGMSASRLVPRAESASDDFFGRSFDNPE